MSFLRKSRLSGLGAWLALAGAAFGAQAEGYGTLRPDYGGIYVPTAEQATLQGYNQNWNQTMRELFYYTPQGSRLLPYAWFLNLEQPNSTAKFIDPANIGRFGLIYDAASAGKHDGLPIGFAKDPVDMPGTGPWVGMNCAACHTNDVTYHGKQVRIDGAPSLADVGAFFAGLAEVVKASRPDIPGNDPAKFARLANAVYGHPPTEAELKAFKGMYHDVALKLEGEMWMRTPPNHAGSGRIDALGQIINALAVFDLQQPFNLRPPSAPVSYPFLWVAPDLDFVQWAPVASSPISRNAGEVLGVFGTTTFTAADPKERLHSSVRLRELEEFENWLRDLRPPPWRKDLFGGIDRDKAQAGKVLFDTDCRSCHHMPPYDRPGELTDPKDNMKGLRFITIKADLLKDVGTDPLYTNNLITRMTLTGSLEGVLGPMNGKPVIPMPGPIAPAAVFFSGAVGGTLQQAFVDQFPDPKERAEKFLEYSGYRFKPFQPGQPPQSYPEVPETAAVSLKAGPLLGIWATAPFLHNGSVPNLYELLSPPEQRSKTFWVGSRELDLKHLGFVATAPQGGPAMCGNAPLFKFDTTQPGNGNGGHIYPKDKTYTEEQKMALIEYLKDPEALIVAQ